MEIEECTYCRRRWLHYELEYEDLPGSSRWFRGLIPKDGPDRFAPETAVDFLGALEWYFAGGTFFGPSNPNGVASWDGSQWSALGGTPNGVFSIVDDFTTFNDGTGNALYVAGYFEDVSDAWSRGVAKWDGSRFWSLGVTTPFPRQTL